MPSFTRDLIERTIRTFIAAILGALTGDIITPEQIDWSKGSLAVALTTGLTAVLSYLAKFFGDRNNASFQTPKP